jgi:hypothetical protein
MGVLNHIEMELMKLNIGDRVFAGMGGLVITGTLLGAGKKYIEILSEDVPCPHCGGEGVIRIMWKRMDALVRLGEGGGE